MKHTFIKSFVASLLAVGSAFTLASCSNGADYPAEDKDGEKLDKATVKMLEGFMEDFYDKRGKVEANGDQASKELVQMACRTPGDIFQPTDSSFGHKSTFEYDIKSIKYDGKFSTGDSWRIFYNLNLVNKETGKKLARNSSYMVIRYNDALEPCINRIGEEGSE